VAKKSEVELAAKQLFNIRYGKYTKTPSAPAIDWYNLAVALYGKDSPEAKDIAPDRESSLNYVMLPNLSKKGKETKSWKTKKKV